MKFTAIETHVGHARLRNWIFVKVLADQRGPVSSAASLEPGFATPSSIIGESVHSDVPWRQNVVTEGFTVEPKGRIVRPNLRPGLGIDINEAEVRKPPFQQETLRRTFYRDGPVGDW